VSETANTENQQPQDVAKEVEKTEAATHRKRAHKRQHNSHAGIWMLLIAIVLIGGGIFYTAQLVTQSRDKLGSQVSELQSSQQTLRADAQEYKQSVAAQLAALQRHQDELTKYIEVIRDSNKHLRKDWLVLEAEYLIQLANYRLLFERDVNTAIVALNSADVRLKETGDPALLNVRKAIASSVQSLKQIEQVDLAGLSLTLTALNKDLEKLPLHTPDPVAKAKEASTELQESKQVTSWTELPAAMWRDIKNLIVIRDHEQPVGPLLSPEQRFFLVENLRLQLEQARLAMLSNQPEVYKERIATAISWIEQYYDKEAAVTKSTLDTLRQLQAVAIAPELPDISPSYNALQKYQAGKPAESKPAVTDKPATENTGNGTK